MYVGSCRNEGGGGNIFREYESKKIWNILKDINIKYKIFNQPLPTHFDIFLLLAIIIIVGGNVGTTFVQDDWL